MSPETWNTRRVRDVRLDGLLRLNGEDFVRAAYEYLLVRPAAPAELPSWVEALQHGTLTKSEVLAAIRDSPEGRARGVPVPDLASVRVGARLRRIPVLGYAVRWVQQIAMLPQLARRLDAQEFGLAENEARQRQAIEALATTLRHEREHDAATHAAALAGISARHDAVLEAIRALDEAKADRSLVQRIEATKADTAAISVVDQQIRSFGVALQVLQDEARKVGLLPPLGATAGGDDGWFDAYYRRFEDRFRGSSDEIRDRLGFYVPILHAVFDALRHHATPARLVDLGSGRGELLELAAEQGLDGYGVDASEAMVEQCRARGLAVVHADAIEHLQTLAADSIAAVTSIQVIEHLPFRALLRLVSEAFRVLRPGGVVILETPNPENLIVGACNFYYDPTHVRPLPPEPMRYLLESIGFERTTIERLHPGATVSDADDATDPVAKVYSAIMRVPQDYALIGYKPASRNDSSHI
jgi:O-antigen chain-terminating methyltransferase